MSDNTTTALHFSRAAAIYHSRAELQRAVAGKLLHDLGNPFEPGRILELGCGTGFLTENLLQRFTRARIDALDISASMIEQARREMADDARIGWHTCDVWNYQAGAVYDLIASSSSLQWMQPLDRLFVRLASMLKPEGRFLCSLMVEGTLGDLHRLRRDIAPGKLPRSPLPTIAETVASLQIANLRVSRSREEILQTEHTSTEDFLRSIKELGFTGGPLAMSSRVLTRSELKRLIERYSEECALPGGKVAANYVIYSFEGIKTSDGKTLGSLAEPGIPIDDSAERS